MKMEMGLGLGWFLFAVDRSSELGVLEMGNCS